MAELGLRDKGIAVLGFTRSDGRYVGAPTGTSVVRPGDVLVVYGRSDQLEELDNRPPGPAGDRKHQEAVSTQDRVEREQTADDVA